MTKVIAAMALLVGVTTVAAAQSQTGSNFGTPYSGTAAARGGHTYSHARARSSGDGGDNEQSGRGSGAEVDARDVDASTRSIAHQASTPEH